LLRPLLLPALCLLLCAGCSSLPDSFPPPPQRPALDAQGGLPVGYFVYMEDPESDRYIVQGFASKSEGTWRWAYEHPVLQFWGPDIAAGSVLHGFLDPGAHFPRDRPRDAHLFSDGKVFDHLLCAQSGQQSYSHEVTAGLLLKNAMNVVSIQPDKFWVSKEDGAKYGFVLTRAGFSE